MYIINCPACGEPQWNWSEEKLLKNKCLKCKHIFYSKDKKTIGKPYGIILSYFVNINGWIKTNWTKFRTVVGNKVISERTVYTSHCWSCRAPIKAVNEGSTFNKFLGNHIYGNKECKKCHHFICNKCGACLCNTPFLHKKEGKKVPGIWKE